MKAELYDLASRVMELATSPDMDARRALWRRHNSFQGGRPPIYLRAFAFTENFDCSALHCTDPMLRGYELELHQSLYRATLGDDYVIEPWLTLDATYILPGGERWGVPVALGEKPVAGGAAAFNPVLRDEDCSCLRASGYQVDERATAERRERLEAALGGAMPVFVSRQGPYSMWAGDISTDIAKLRGLEQLMWDVYDRPEWLHQLLGFMRDAILANLDAAERAGGFALADHQNQCMPYALELADPDPNATGVPCRGLWRFMAAQEFTGFSPDMFWEFILQYQQPIMERFGLSAYGCCEDLTGKIKYLRRIKNLRRIAVSPFADARRCAEEIGRDYILSWRPNPSSMVARGLDEEYVRRYLRAHFEIFKSNGNVFDITLKDVETVNHQPQNVRRWTEIVRQELDRL